ncbi:hypothetical protein ABIE35_003404 [Paenarthrobacter sp. 4246]
MTATAPAAATLTPEPAADAFKDQLNPNRTDG